MLTIWHASNDCVQCATIHLLAWVETWGVKMSWGVKIGTSNTQWA